MTTIGQARAMAIFVVVVLCLIAGSQPRSPGDGAEYVAMAMNFERLEGPSLGRRAIPEIERRLAALDPALLDWHIETVTVHASDSRRDFVHFWFYSLLAAPLLRLTDSVGLPPPSAFTILNVALLGIAFLVALPRIGPWATLLVFAGPLLWWIDKPHTEVFTVSLLLVAFALMRDKPWWALVATGMAATQNPPMSVVFLLMLVAAVIRDRRLASNWRFIAGAAAGFTLSALHPVYYYWRYHTPSLLLTATRPGFPSFAELSAVLVDPAIGMIGNYPVFAIVVAAAFLVVLLRHPRQIVSMEIAVAALSGVAFLVACAQTTNVHHGGTPSLSRYVLWFVPLALPVLAVAWAHGGRFWKAFTAATSVTSATACLFAFHPAVAEAGREPTWAATWMWTRHPAAFDPLPEIFAEVNARREEVMVPVSTANCEKVLLAGAGGTEVAWPMPCYPAVAPPACLPDQFLCYANHTPNGYSFAPTPGRRSGTVTRNPGAWPIEMNANVRAIFDAWGWAGLVPPRAEIAALRRAADVSTMIVGSDTRFGIVLYEFGHAPRLTFRFSSSMTGKIVDPRAGAVLRQIDIRDPGEALWDLELPSEYGVLILLLTSEHAA